MPHRAIACTLSHTGLSLPVIVLAFAVFKTHQLVRHGEVEYGPYPHRSVKTIYSDAMEIQGTGNKVMTLLVHRVFSLSTQREQNTVGVAGVRIRRMKYKRPPVANTFATRGNLRHVSHHQHRESVTCITSHVSHQTCHITCITSNVSHQMYHITCTLTEGICLLPGRLT